jgi:hypothetical protein
MLRFLTSLRIGINCKIKANKIIDYLIIILPLHVFITQVIFITF